jgi:hypothetical protein
MKLLFNFLLLAGVFYLFGKIDTLTIKINSEAELTISKNNAKNLVHNLSQAKKLRKFQTNPLSVQLGFHWYNESK